MISVEFDTAPAVARLDTLKERLRAAARSSIENSAARLLSIIQGKLSGEVLNSRSGALLRSIRVEVLENAAGFAARLSSDGSVPYARIQEYGGRLNIPALTPTHGKALAFAYGGRLVFAKATAAHIVNIPERSYMRSSIDEYQSGLLDNIRAAVAGVITRANRSFRARRSLAPCSLSQATRPHSRRRRGKSRNIPMSTRRRSRRRSNWSSARNGMRARACRPS
jgi:hypothetical protein